MKFKIRPGYAVHREIKRTVSQGGRQVPSTTTSSHWEGEIVDLSPEEADDHITKLEPTDKESDQFLKSRVKAA